MGRVPIQLAMERGDEPDYISKHYSVKIFKLYYLTKILFVVNVQFVTKVLYLFFNR